jgi:hypothetical protein
MSAVGKDREIKVTIIVQKLRLFRKDRTCYILRNNVSFQGELQEQLGE